MPPSQSLNLDQRTVMRLSAQQLRFVKLLELNAPELDDAIEKELDDNPALEKAEEPAPEPTQTPRYLSYANNSSPDDDVAEFAPPDAGETLYESLSRQLSERSLPEKVAQAAEYIIGNLDPNGYLRRTLPSIVNDMAFGPGIEVTEEDAREALKAVQQLEPYGVGAADLRESLLIQLRHLPESQTRDDAIDILEHQFEAFTMKHTHRIVSGLKISKERARDATLLITTLNPKPGASVSAESNSANVIVPDIVVSNDDGRFTISMGNRIPELAIDRSFTEAMEELEKKGSRKERKGSEFITSRYNDAKSFINILRQRQETLLDVMGAILSIQKEYFQTQDVYRLKPMMIKDISALTGLDISVVSRATNNKYVATPWGIFPLRFFFSDSIGDDPTDSADALTNRKIEAEIQAIVEKEDKRHPLSDEKIRSEMEKRGFDVSRRTVAKYRDRLEIPVARLRKDV